jgi:hypothetical protein
VVEATDPMRPKMSATVEVLAIAVLLAAITYFLFEPDAFNTFLEWLFQVL